MPGSWRAELEKRPSSTRRADGHDPTGRQSATAFAGFSMDQYSSVGRSLAPLIRNSREGQSAYRRELRLSDSLNLAQQSGAAGPLAAEVRRNARIAVPGWSVNLQSADGDYSRALPRCVPKARGFVAVLPRRAPTFHEPDARPSAPFEMRFQVGAGQWRSRDGGPRPPAGP